MILQLGSGFEAIRVTAEYSNALLLATLPYFSDYAQKMDLPVPHPTRVADVAIFKVVPIRDAGISIGIKGTNGVWGLWCVEGCINGFEGPHSYFALQDPDAIRGFYGSVRMSKDQAVQLARETIRKLGIPLESVFAEQEPRVILPERIGTNLVPHYRIEWDHPAGGGHAVDVEVNGDARRVERFYMSSAASRQSLPRISFKTAIDPPVQQRWPPPNPEYAWRLLPIVLRAVDQYGETLSLPIPRPLTTNHVARFELYDNRGWPHSELELTNGWRFIYRNSMVNGFYAPDALFSKYQRRILIKEFLGKWNMTERQAIALVYETLTKLNYPTNHVHIGFRPEISTAAVRKGAIPRFRFSWWYKQNKNDTDLHSKVEAEVDASKRELKSLYYDDKAYWNHPPPIDVPISLPPGMNGKPAEGPSRPPGMPIPGGARK